MSGWGWQEADRRWAGERFFSPPGHSSSPQGCLGCLWTGCGTDRSATPFVNNSARTSARRQTHEPEGKRNEKDREADQKMILSKKTDLSSHDCTLNR